MHVAVRVGQHLDFDVARIDHELLDEDAVVAERIACASDRRPVEPVAHLRLAPGDAHALAAAAGRGLDHHGIADLAGDLLGMTGILDDAEQAGNRADLGRIGEFLRFDLVAHGHDRLRVSGR